MPTGLNFVQFDWFWDYSGGQSKLGCEYSYDNLQYY